MPKDHEHDHEPVDRDDPRRGNPETDPRRRTDRWRAGDAPVAECLVCDSVLDANELASGTCSDCGSPLFEDKGLGDEDVDSLIGLQEEGEDHGITFESPTEPIAGGSIDYAIIPRSTWAARPPTYVAYMKLPAPDFWQHHAADAGVYGGADASRSAEQAYCRAVQNYHMDSKGWSDIAYSFVEFPSGRIYEGRGWARTGGHTLNHNSTSHAVCAAGNYMTLVPTVAMLEGTAWLVVEGRRLGKVSEWGMVGGHRDVGQTACPGDKLYAQLPYIREVIEAGGPEPVGAELAFLKL